MGFIRDKSEERTGYQIGSMPPASVDNQCDYVLVYRLDDSAEERIRRFKELGYVIHFMSGISWGHYQDWLFGDYDGVNHWDEAQEDRDGNKILHSRDVPYMCPTIGFTDYLTEKFKKIVDLGVEAIHVEEPEFWDRAGYSPAFKREFELYYRSPWAAPHTSVDARYKCARLKQYLFTRTIDRLASSLKEYAKTKYGQNLRFYVPTHSLLNYTQWKIVSPEGRLADIPAVDGCIAQVWTGTSREKNWFDGVHAERTFETAFLEYGVMQELVKGTGRHMWFLHDPIEDNPAYDWNDYRKNYLCTVAASLLHPRVDTFEICPWPNRVFEEKYPKNSPDAESISPEYTTLLNNMFNTLGDIESSDTNNITTGILMGDCELYQREYPDSEFSEEIKRVTGTVLLDDAQLLSDIKNILFEKGEEERELMLKYLSSNAFPAFYSLALPLVKYGVPVRPVLLDNTRRYPGYLDDYKVLIMSYEYMKPEYPDVNIAIAQWVRQGGTLIYAGNGFDPYHNIESWWTGKYPTAAEHLFEMLGVELSGEKTVTACGRGRVGIIKMNPAVFSFSKENADIFRDFYEKTVYADGGRPEYRNHLTLRRGKYIITSVMTESVCSEPVTHRGLFADMFSPCFDVHESFTVRPGENSMLCDLTHESIKPLDVIGTSSRIYSLTDDGGKITLTAYGAGCLDAKIRIKTPRPVSAAFVDGEKTELIYDSLSSTALISYRSEARKVTITVK